MTQNFRKTVMATSMLAGLAIFTLDAAQAGPNGPSFSGGSISGFSSMRMDFNRIGGPGRALSRNELRIVPIDVVKPTEKPKDSKNVGKNISKKDTKVARVSNPKSSGGGKGKQDLGNGPNLHVPAALADAYRITGGNLGDLSGFDQWAGRLGLGPLVFNAPFLPGNDGSFNWPVDKPDTEQHRFDPNSLLNWYASAPGQPETGKTGQATGDAWRITEERRSESGDISITVYNKQENRYQVHYWDGDTHVHSVADYAPGDRPGLSLPRSTEVVIVPGGGAEPSEKEDAPKEEAEKKDSQPAPEGYGRPTNGGGWCSPTGGCYRPARNGSPRIIPTETDGGTISAQRQSPTWATDPSEEGYTGGGGGGGYTGYRPQDEEGGDIGGEGNPETGGGIDRPGIPEPVGAAL